MKKNLYVKPEINIVEIIQQQTLLAGSMGSGSAPQFNFGDAGTATGDDIFDAD